MTHLRTRNEIMEWLEKHPPNPTVARALQDGETELLGVFRHIPPHGSMGWIVNVTTRHGATWHIAITPDRFGADFYCHDTSRVCWQHWMGDVEHGELPAVTSGRPLYAGDNPEKYRRLKDAETKE